jgi:hypothetical protein
MPTVQTTHACSFTKIVLQDAKTAYPFRVPLYITKLILCVGVAHLLLIFSVMFSLFVFHRLIVSFIDVVSILSFFIFTCFFFNSISFNK